MWSVWTLFTTLNLRESEFIWFSFSWQKKPKCPLESETIYQIFPPDEWMECYLGIMWASCLPPSEYCDVGFNRHCVQALKTWRRGVVGTPCVYCWPNMRWDESNGHTSGEMRCLRSDKKSTHEGSRQIGLSWAEPNCPGAQLSGAQVSDSKKWTIGLRAVGPLDSWSRDNWAPKIFWNISSFLQLCVVHLLSQNISALSSNREWGLPP